MRGESLVLGYTVPRRQPGRLRRPDRDITITGPTMARSSSDLASLSAADGFVIQGETARADHAGWSVAAAGDVNGDGIPDVIVGAPGHDDTGTDLEPPTSYSARQVAMASTRRDGR